MEIRNNPIGGSGRIDLTKANRDAIRDRNPIDRPADEAKNVNVNDKPVIDPALGQLYPKRVQAARDQYEIAQKSVKNRVADARARFAAEQAKDHVQLSSELADVAATDRADRVRELKADYDAGRLDPDSLVAEAARRMLLSD